MRQLSPPRPCLPASCQRLSAAVARRKCRVSQHANKELAGSQSSKTTVPSVHDASSYRQQEHHYLRIATDPSKDRARLWAIGARLLASAFPGFEALRRYRPFRVRDWPGLVLVNGAMASLLPQPYPPQATAGTSLFMVDADGLALNGRQKKMWFCTRRQGVSTRQRKMQSC
jgi:hypothetical protein